MSKFRNLKLFSLVCILAFALVFIGFHFLQAQGKPDKDKPPGKPKPPPPALSLDYGDIVTTESNALRVWNYNEAPYDPIWSTESPGYRSVAVGDVDGDGMKEIVVPEIQEVKGRGRNAASYLKIFLNIYKEGESGIWKSTEDYEEGYIFEDELYSHTEVMIADVDSVQGNEVILLTYHNLVVFRYVGENFIIVNSIDYKKFDPTEDERSHFCAVTAGEVPGSGETSENRIIVSFCNSHSDTGSVYILNEDLSLCEPIPVEIEGETQVFLGRHSLRVADLDGDSYSSPEICSTGYYGRSKDNGVGWKAYVIVWDWNDGGEWVQKQRLLPGWDGEPENSFPYVYLDTGDLNSNGDEEIVVSANLPGYSGDYQLILYDYIAGFTPGPMISPVPARIYDVEVGDTSGDESNEIVVAGRARGGANLVFYLEVFGSNLEPLWRRVGENRKEGTVIDTAIVK